MARRVEEREADPDRDLEQARALAWAVSRSPSKTRASSCGRGEGGGVAPDVAQRAAQCLDLERRDVDQPGRSARTPLEGAEQLGHRAGADSEEHPGAHELGDEGVEVVM